MTWAYVCGIIVCIIFSHIFSSAEASEATAWKAMAVAVNSIISNLYIDF